MENHLPGYRVVIRRGGNIGGGISAGARQWRASLIIGDLVKFGEVKGQVMPQR